MTNEELKTEVAEQLNGLMDVRGVVPAVVAINAVNKCIDKAVPAKDDTGDQGIPESVLKKRREILVEQKLEEVDDLFKSMESNLGNKKYLIGYRGNVKQIVISLA